MSKDKRRYVGKIGACNNAVLGLRDKFGRIKRGWHCVYIREVKGDRCDVNVITSLETRDGWYKVDKLTKVKRGYLYPIPKNDADFPLWSAINLDGNIKGVKITDIKNIGSKSMKRRHKFFVGKFTKKK